MATLKLTQDFREFLSLLNQERTEYLLIGGYAVAFHGYVRATKDMDVWVATSPENLERLRGALLKFGFTAQTLPRELFAEGKTMLRMGMPPNRLEVLSRIAGVRFDDCYARRRTVEVDGVEIHLIDYDDLRANKLATGRPQDLADVKYLDKSRGTRP